ncbi:histidine phosphatase family protein [Lyngbya sp. CCY1209]|uniref:histidine phosphatase family protein n=1 Tax=Lyngbya sp. CCY1209 TaxID=2886103 RepID=UPI002D20681E|nr:histidine phosphatase family protein [Lyngbya sp. CCY1209]MEB3886115.1 histidine phosphatase family protein [Lyngbya sp. CCY1209]
MTQTVWIARHGNRIDFVNPEWFNTAERRYDPHLSPDGRVQARQLADRLAGENITHIFASPFLRTVETADAVAEVLDLPLQLDWGLAEWLNPEWMSEMPETLSVEHLSAKFPRIDPTYTGGKAYYPETWPACLKRTGETAKRLVKAYPEDNLLFVGHGASVLGTAMGLIPTLRETDVHASLCCLVKLVKESGEWVMELNGDTSHLDETEEVVRFN